MKKLMMAVVAAIATVGVASAATSQFYWSFQDAGNTDYVMNGTGTGKLTSGTAYLFYATSYSGGTRSSGKDAAVAALTAAIDSGKYSFGDNWDATIIEATGGDGFKYGVFAIAKADIKDGQLYKDDVLISNNQAIGGKMVKFETDRAPIQKFGQGTTANTDKFFMVFTTDNLTEGDDGTYYCIEQATSDSGVPFTDQLQWTHSGAGEIKALTSNAANWSSYSAIPEPTSGLLMLIGMAGLALKRKRA